jgi:outer membrane protein
MNLRVLTQRLVLVLSLSAAAVSTSAMAKEQGDWLVRFGGSNVDPKSDNSDIVSVDSQFGVTFNFSYFMTSNLAVELLAALPYDHDIELLDGTKVASTDHLPPTLSLQYHFMPEARVQPYVGLGLNYTLFFHVDTTGPLAGADLDLDNSWGWAGELGVDFPVSEQWLINLSARYIDIDTDAKLDGASLGTVEIDPWVYGAHVGFRF